MARQVPAPVLAAVVRAVRELITGAVLYNARIGDRVGLRANDEQFVGALELYGPMTAGQLAAISGYSTGAVTGVIDRLVQAGFARREGDPSDRRKVVVVAVQEKIDAELVPLYRDQAATVEAALEGLDDAELDAVSRFLQRLVERGRP